MSTFRQMAKTYKLNKTLSGIQLALAILCCLSSILLLAGPPFDLDAKPAVYMFNISADICGEFICVVLISCLFLEIKQGRTFHKSILFLSVLLSLESLALLADEGSWLVHGLPELNDWGYLFNTFYFLWIAAICYIWCHYLKAVIETPPKWYGHFIKIISVLFVIYFLMLFASLFGIDIFFTIDENGEYRRLPMQTYGLLLSGVVLLVSCYSLISQKHLPVSQRFVLASFVLIPVLGAIIQTFHFGLSITYQLNLLSLIMIFVQIHLERGRQLAQQEQEAERRRTEIMLSQIQPHFLYNSLTAVMGIEGNPRETLDALSNFSRYLRGNLSMLNSSGMVPFTQELTHLNSYLYLEKLRFDSRLQIEIDTPVTDFSIPPLALQMIAENAIKHGITAQDKGGVLVISTSQTDDAFVIRVLDNGVGFDVEEAYQREGDHVGLRSVSERLTYLCDGTMDIQSSIGAGTCVTITLPKKGQLS